MVEPITFASTTAQFDLPLLFAGQAQKEFVLNQVTTMVDALLQGSIEASLSSPPAIAKEGDSYRVLAGALDGWAGQEDSLAIRVGGDWKFVAPSDGMQIFDRAVGQMLFYRSQWLTAAVPFPVQGGNTVDAEARAALAQVIAALQNFGILSQG